MCSFECVRYTKRIFNIVRFHSVFILLYSCCFSFFFSFFFFFFFIFQHETAFSFQLCLEIVSRLLTSTLTRDSRIILLFQSFSLFTCVYSYYCSLFPPFFSSNLRQPKKKAFENESMIHRLELFRIFLCSSVFSILSFLFFSNHARQSLAQFLYPLFLLPSFSFFLTFLSLFLSLYKCMNIYYI